MPFSDVTTDEEGETAETTIFVVSEKGKPVLAISAVSQKRAVEVAKKHFDIFELMAVPRLLIYK